MHVYDIDTVLLSRSCKWFSDCAVLDLQCIVLVVDPVSLQNYLMSWLHESTTDSEQLHLLFPQSDGEQAK